MTVPVSVVVVTYRRPEGVPGILAAWLAQTSDVWLCDCSRHPVRDIPPGTRYVRFAPDPGSRTRHAVATLASGDLVIKADDDIVPKPGLVDHFRIWMERLGPAILGIHGRTFQGRDYYRNTTLYGAKQLARPQPVDFCGVITCSPREYLPMDLRACATEVEDLFWQMQCYRKAKKFVIPTAAYSNLESCKDALRLCGSAQARAVRRKYYERWWVRNYRRPDGMTG